MQFISPKNYKRGMYILNKYRLKDIVIQVVILSICTTGLITYLNVLNGKNLFIIICIVSICILGLLLFTPMPFYLNLYDWIQAKMHFQLKQKNYKYEGVLKNEEE